MAAVSASDEAASASVVSAGALQLEASRIWRGVDRATAAVAEVARAAMDKDAVAALVQAAVEPLKPAIDELEVAARALGEKERSDVASIAATLDELLADCSSKAAASDLLERLDALDGGEFVP